MARLVIGMVSRFAFMLVIDNYSFTESSRRQIFINFIFDFNLAGIVLCYPTVQLFRAPEFLLPASRTPLSRECCSK